jgi:hypothetical protein
MASTDQSPAEKKTKATGHPSIEDLLTYRSGELSSEEKDRIRDHLADCSESAEEILALERFESEQPQREELRLSDDVMEDDFKRLSGRLPTSSVVQRRFRFQNQRIWAAAAMVAIAVGAAAWLTIRQPAKPQPIQNVDVIDLFSTKDSAERDPRADEWTALSQGYTLLVLNVSRLEEFSTYELEIKEWLAKDQVVRKVSGLRRREKGNFTLLVPKGFLPTGRYTLTLMGIAEDGDRVRLAVYPIALE